MQRSRGDEKNLIPWQQHLVIFNKVTITEDDCKMNTTVIFICLKAIVIMICQLVDGGDDDNESLQTRILKNQEGCVNTLSMECMDFYHRF